MSTWFRVHNDILDNPKLILIAESDRWRYLGLLSLKSQGVLDQFDGDKLDRVIAAKLRLTPAEWAETKRRLQEENLIDDIIQPVGWEDRQFKSDSSADRVRKHRAKKARDKQQGEGEGCNDDVTLHGNDDETLQKRPSNDGVTGPEDRLQSTDTENPKTSCAELASSTPPAKGPVEVSPVVITLPTNRYGTRGEEYAVTQVHLDQFAELYPAVDVLQAVRKACGWLVTNPKQRKTKSGMPKFLNAWLSREQDRGGSPQGGRPAPARQSTRHASLEEDLGDTSWATPAPTAEPAPVAAQPVAQLPAAPQGGGFKVLPRLQEAIEDEDPEGVIYRCGTKLLTAAGETQEGAQRQLRDMLGNYKPGRLLEGVMVGMAGRYTDLGWLDSITAGQAKEIPKDWAPSPATLAGLSAQGLPEELHTRSRAAFLAWFSWSEIRCADWDDLFSRMCLIEWARADGSATQYIQTLAAAAAVGSQHAWQEPA
jgi:hypothetical protein